MLDTVVLPSHVMGHRELARARVTCDILFEIVRETSYGRSFVATSTLAAFMAKGRIRLGPRW